MKNQYDSYVATNVSEIKTESILEVNLKDDGKGENG